jgi:hypothetical protein
MKTLLRVSVRTWLGDYFLRELCYIFPRIDQAISCVNLLPPPDDITFLRTAHAIFAKYLKFPEALSLAIRLGDAELISQDFHAPANPCVITHI